MIVEELSTGIFGVGDTTLDALVDCHQALVDQYDVLKAKGGMLADHLQAQLIFLKRFFSSDCAITLSTF